MKYLFLILLLCFLPAGGRCNNETESSLVAKKEIYQNPWRAAGAHYAYPSPTGKLTPAPEGYKPFYIAHYSRHGSRYATETNDYDNTIPLLEKADSLNILTAKGKRALRKLHKAYEATKGNTGKLSLLGARQHHQIAHRMFSHYPEVFGAGCSVNAYSTRVDRCVKSMNNFCDELLSLNPSLNITKLSDPKYYYFMACKSDSLPAFEVDKSMEKKLDSINTYYRHKINISPVLFKDTAFATRNHVKNYHLGGDLFDIWANVQNMPELHLDFSDLFTKEQLYDQWKYKNMGWAKSRGSIQGFSPKYKAMKGWLREMLAREAIAYKTGKTGVTLCFGHDSYLYPLAFYLGMERAIVYTGTDIDKLDQAFQHYHIIPMGGNIQLIFFRKEGIDDVLVKFLLHEEEQHVSGIPTDIWPYYHLTDVINHFKEDL